MSEDIDNLRLKEVLDDTVDFRHKVRDFALNTKLPHQGRIMCNFTSGYCVQTVHSINRLCSFIKLTCGSVMSNKCSWRNHNV